MIPLVLSPILHWMTCSNFDTFFHSDMKCQKYKCIVITFKCFVISRMLASIQKIFRQSKFTTAESLHLAQTVTVTSATAIMCRLWLLDVVLEELSSAHLPSLASKVLLLIWEMEVCGTSSVVPVLVCRPKQFFLFRWLPLWQSGYDPTEVPWSKKTNIY